MCVDYRKLNSITVKDKYPMPLIDDQIDMLGGNKYFTALDLASGFYQIPMARDSIEKTAFVTQTGHYEFLRMPFGLANSPSVFQKLINNVLRGLVGKTVFSYMDDLIIPSTSVEQGLVRLEEVLKALRSSNLTLKLSKCSFFQTTIDYLGQEISLEGVKPGTRKIMAIKNMPAPKDIKGIRQFLGLSGYFRKYVKNYASITEPLTRLLKRDKLFEWTKEQMQAFQSIKDHLVTRPVLAIFDPKLPTELHTDASSLGFGGILIQINECKPQVVAYFSKQTSPEQHKYHSYELETLAVVLSLQRFRVYLLGIQFKVVTDCSALRTAFTKKDLIPRVGRWWLQVQDCNSEVIHRPGNKMEHVDALSRNPVENYLDVVAIDLTEGDWVLTVQLQDDQLSKIRNILKEGNVTREFKQYFEKYLLKDDKVFRVLDDGTIRWVVPKSVRWQVCRLCHDDNGHFGLEKTIKKISENYWFKGMRQFVRKYVQACLNCKYYKHTSGKKEGFLHPIEKIPTPFHTLHIDHVGPFVTSTRKNKYIFVVVDGFTKFCFLEALPDTTSRRATKALLGIVHMFGPQTELYPTVVPPLPPGHSRYFARIMASNTR